MQHLSFYRKQYSQLWLVITPNEPLGFTSPGNYIEDYFGTGSQATLRNIVTNTRQALLFTDTNALSLSGYIPLNTLANGTYEFEGWITDLVGNKTIIGEVLSPSITGTVVEVQLTIHAAVGVGATLNVVFQNTNLNFRLELIDDVEFESNMKNQVVSNVEFANQVNIDMGMMRTIGYNYSVELLTDVDPILENL